MTKTRPPERRQLTVMFCDMVASTALSLRLDPEELSEVIQAYRQRVAEVITGHGGMVARQVGDAVLAYFGYPHAHENDAERAIRAALAIAKAPWPQAGAADLRVHIGIATGVVVVGNLPQGGEELSAIGSALNLAARLEGLAGPGMVVVSDQTRRLSGGLFEYRDLGPQALKGFDAPVPAWEVLGENREASRFHALRAPDRTPLVDRHHELAELRRLWDLVRAGQGQALLISSEAGVGKSRLVDELTKRIVDRRCLRLWYHCYPNLQGTPLAPLVRHLTAAADFAEHDDDDAKLSKLARLVPAGLKDPGELVPLLADLLSVRYETKYPPLNMSPQRQKHQLIQALLQLVEAVAGRGPAVLVVEDLHWIDPSSEELIGALLDRLSALPALVVLTARPEFRSHWDETRLHRMSLAPLERQDSISMIKLICGEREIPESTIGQIADKTDGMPLFIEDLTRDVLESTGPQQGAGPVRQAPGAIPATLTDSLTSRLDRLGPAKAVAEIGAVVGREFSYELLAKVAGLPEMRLKEELDRLVDAGLLVSRRATSGLGYAFKHALVRDAAYSSLLKKTQASLHARIARVLVEEFPETAESQPEVLAYHFQSANDVDNAVDYLLRAARLSARRSGFVEAIAQLESALRLLGAQPRSRERLRLELRVHRTLGGIYAEYRGFSSAECGRAYATALELCRELGDTPEIFSVLSGLGSFEITRAGFARCQALAEECLARAAGQGSKPPFVMGHLLLGGTLFLRGELAAGRQHLEEAVSIYEHDQAAVRGKQVLYVQDQKSTGLCYLALTLTIMGYLGSGLRAGESGLAHSQSLGGAHTINFSLCYLAAVHHIRGDAASALACATRSLEMAREQSFATWIGISQVIRGVSLVSQGNREEGLAELSDGVSAHAGMEAATYQPFALALLAQGLVAAERLDAALDTVDRALAISEATGERFYAAELLRLKGEILAATGHRAPAETCLREAIDVSRRQEARLFGLRSATSLCRLLEGSGRQAALRDILRPLHDWFGEAVDAPDVRDARALLVRPIGT